MCCLRCRICAMRLQAFSSRSTSCCEMSGRIGKFCSLRSGYLCSNLGGGLARRGSGKPVWAHFSGLSSALNPSSLYEAGVILPPRRASATRPSVHIPLPLHRSSPESSPTHQHHAVLNPTHAPRFPRVADRDRLPRLDASDVHVVQNSPSVTSASFLSNWGKYRLFGSRFCSGFCPPSNPSRTAFLAHCPFCPRPEVFPHPQPRPRPTRTSFFFAPSLSRMLSSRSLSLKSICAAFRYAIRGARTEGGAAGVSVVAVESWRRPSRDAAP
ncbi:unnamed protein product [Chondrus crispus]|uniref:Uncharacterized protein n=1 Tax=Chondrus crispus TaxID=2769 RepID=R7QPM4_CHOCR|nr:unnamed protein product [Chondrus crispus]CDF39733.1 unnamed protein product [Chondrus crispus]|eukprot:XP_005710027.1 unnamed protein product [Chondrus crispus]